jgi:uncharacterized protein (TIGR03435 family)
MLFAFDLPSKELLVGLDWSDLVRFDAEGLAPPETPQPQLRLMVRRLLEERLHLVVRREQRTIRHLALVVGRDGRKFKDAVEAPVPATQTRGRINHKRMPMRLLVSLLIAPPPDLTAVPDPGPRAESPSWATMSVSMFCERRRPAPTHG